MIVCTLCFSNPPEAPWRDQIISRTLGFVPLSGWRETVPMLDEFIKAKMPLAEKYLQKNGVKGQLNSFEGLLRCVVQRAPLLLLHLQRMSKNWPDEHWEEVLSKIRNLNIEIDENAVRFNECVRTRK